MLPWAVQGVQWQRLVCRLSDAHFHYLVCLPQLCCHHDLYSGQLPGGTLHLQFRQCLRGVPCQLILPFQQQHPLPFSRGFASRFLHLLPLQLPARQVWHCQRGQFRQLRRLSKGQLLHGSPVAVLVSTGKEVMGDCLSMMAHFLINGTLNVYMVMIVYMSH